MPTTTTSHRAVFPSFRAVILAIGICLWAGMAWGQGIDPNHEFAWSENTGWLNFNPAQGNVAVYASHLEGHVWGENIGWIRLGSHSGGGEHTYQNTAPDNFGVNRSGSQLSGYAWGENIGWINFGPSAQHPGVAVDPTTGDFSGYAWGENVGWVKVAGQAGDGTPYKLKTDPLSSEYTLAVQSTGAAGVDITASPTTYAGTTNYTTTDIPDGTQITLTAPAASGGANFSSWTGCDSTDAAARTCTVTMDGDKTVEAGYSSLCQALDNCDLPWTTGGNAAWFGQSDVAYFGGSSAQSGRITHNQSSTLETTVTGPGELSFYWKVSSESGYDPLRFLVGSEVRDTISGGQEWRRMQYSLPSGTHTLRWSYAKDGSVSSGADAGWVDQVVWTPAETVTLSVNSSGASGVVITANPSTYGGTTDYTTTNIPNGTQITLTAPAGSGGTNFSSWTGCDSTDAAARTCTVTMDGDKTVEAVYSEVGEVSNDLLLTMDTGATIDLDAVESAMPADYPFTNFVQTGNAVQFEMQFADLRTKWSNYCGVGAHHDASPTTMKLLFTVHQNGLVHVQTVDSEPQEHLNVLAYTQGLHNYTDFTGDYLAESVYNVPEGNFSDKPDRNNLLARMAGLVYEWLHVANAVTGGPSNYYELYQRPISLQNRFSTPITVIRSILRHQQADYGHYPEMARPIDERHNGLWSPIASNWNQDVQMNRSFDVGYANTNGSAFFISSYSDNGMWGQTTMSGLQGVEEFSASGGQYSRTYDITCDASTQQCRVRNDNCAGGSFSLLGTYPTRVEMETYTTWSVLHLTAAVAVFGDIQTSNHQSGPTQDDGNPAPMKWVYEPVGESSQFHDDFDNGLDNWVLFGSPRSVIRENVFGKDHVFDNMGDANYNSGGVSVQTVGSAGGFSVDSDIYVDVTNVTGCWNGASIGLTRQPNPGWNSDGDDTAYGVNFSLGYAGDACWATPEEFRRHGAFGIGFVDESNTWHWFDSFDSESPFMGDAYMDKWVRLRFDVSADRTIRFFADGNLIWAPEHKLHPDLMEGRNLTLGMRSSGSAGKAYHDFIRVTSGDGPTTHTVTPSAGDGGSIAPDTPQTVTHGDTAAFAVTPEAGYAASVGGTCPAGAFSGNTYVTGAIVADCTVEFTFEDTTVSLGEALDNTDLDWRLSGDAAWFGQTDVAFFGGSSAQSGRITDNQTSTLETTVTGPGELSFSWKVSSESGYDPLRFFVGSEVRDTISGVQDWREKQYSLPSGNHTLRWSYAKDGSVSSDADAGWVDQVAWNPTPVTYTVTATTGSGGSVTPDSRSVDLGAAAGFTVTPDSGWEHGPADGTCPEGSFSGNTYTTGAIDADCTVHFLFVRQTGSLRVAVEPSAARDAGAQWRRVGTSTWRNGGTGESSVPIGSHFVECKPVSGWTTPAEITVSVRQNETATATCRYEEQGYAVVYHGNGHTSGAVPIDSGSPYREGAEVVVLDGGDLARAGHAFTGWNTSADGTGEVHEIGSTFSMPADDVHLYAQWEARLSSVTYHGNNQDVGEPPVDKGIYRYGDWVFVLGNSGNLAKDGHTFEGWNDKPDGSGADYAPDSRFQIQGDVDLYAKWAPIPLRRLYLPRIDGTGEWATQIGLVNAGLEPAHLTLFVAFRDGVVARECEIELPAGDRVEYVAGVDKCLPAVQGYGYVETYSDSVAGFVRLGKNKTYRMSLPLREAYGEAETFIPYVQSNKDQETHIGLVNPTNESREVTITFLAEDEKQTAVTLSVAAGEQRLHTIPELLDMYEGELPEIPENVITASISNVQGMVGFFMLEHLASSQLDGLLFTPSSRSVLIPHVYGFAEDEWTTILVFANPSQDESVELTLTGYSIQGGQGDDYTLTLAPGQRQVLFPWQEPLSLSDDVAWLSGSSDKPVAGMVNYIVTPEGSDAPETRRAMAFSATAETYLRHIASEQDPANWAMIPVVNTTARGGVFPILDADGRMDVSLVNTSGSPAFVTLEAVAADGSIKARTDSYMRGYSKLWKDSAEALMQGWSEEEVDLTGARYIRFASTRPMSGVQINGSDGSFRQSTMVDSLVAQPYPLQDAYALTLENGVRSGMFPFGRKVSISAVIPEDRWYVFTQWTSEDPWNLERLDNIYNPNALLTMPAGPVNLKAEYERRGATKYRLDVEKGRTSGDYSPGQAVSVRADDEAGQFFARWIGDGAPYLTRINTPSAQVFMPRQDIVIEATYTDTRPDPRELTVLNGRPSGTNSYPFGRTVRIFADLPPNLDMMFDKWTGEAYPVANVNLPDTQLTMPNEKILIEATFKPVPVGDFALTVQTEVPEAESRVSAAALHRLAAYRTTQSPRPGHWVTIEAPAAPEGLVFDLWTGQTAAVEDVTSPRTRMYMPDHNVTVVATYREIDGETRYQVTYNANQGDNPPADSGSYLEKETVTVPGPGNMERKGFAFMAWHDRPNREEARLDDRDYLPGDAFAMPAQNKTLYAQWIVEAEREQLVRASCLGSCHTADEFAGLNLSRAEWEAAVARMIQDQEVILDGLNRQVVTDYLVEAYTPSFTIEVAAWPEQGGQVEVVGGNSFESGTQATVRATANEGWNFSHWTRDGERISEDMEYTFPVEDNHVLMAHFDQQTVEAIPTLSEWGLILLTALMLVLGVGCLRRQRFGPLPTL